MINQADVHGSFKRMSKLGVDIARDPSPQRSPHLLEGALHSRLKVKGASSGQLLGWKHSAQKEQLIWRHEK